MQRKRIGKAVKMPRRRLSFKISPKTDRGVHCLMDDHRVWQEVNHRSVPDTMV